MTSMVPHENPFPDSKIREFLSILDTGQTLDETQAMRWRFAIEDGNWTPEEAVAAARDLNLHHVGYVKIAHVHENIERQRKTWRLARMFCWQHPTAADFLADRYDRPFDAAATERHWQDERWDWLKQDGYADQIMERLPAAEWKRWATANSKNFRSEL